MRYVQSSAAILFLLISGSAFSDTVQEKRVIATMEADGVQRVEVVGGSYYFDPNTIDVKVNVPVELKVRKEPGMTPHSIVIHAPEAGIDFSESLSTESKVIRCTPTKVGTYPFVCDKGFLFFKSHKERGMEGILEVVQ